MARTILATISKSALQHNLNQVRKLAPNSKVLAMVKANAYGHGLIETAYALKTADAFGVASIEEALKLRQAGIQNEIVLMEGFFAEDELDLIAEQKLTCVLHHWPQVQALQDYSRQTKINVWVKINTGMNRLGFMPHEFQEAFEALKKLEYVEITGFMSHFAHADEKKSQDLQEPYQLFTKMVGNKPGLKSMANSAAILSAPFSHHDWVRPGLMLYGIVPFANETGAQYNLKPAMSLTATLIALHALLPNQKVGYGGTWTSANRQAKIGIVSMGYGDGYPWHAKNGTPVLVNQQIAHLAGRVSMDMLAVDVTSIHPVQVGDLITLWGNEVLPIEVVAQHAQTIPYELLCRFTERVSRVYRD